MMAKIRINNVLVHSLLGLLLLTTTAVAEDSLKNIPRVKQELVAPPFLPRHQQISKGPKIVEVRLEIDEKRIVIDDAGTEVWAFTYGGS